MATKKPASPFGDIASQQGELLRLMREQEQKAMEEADKRLFPDHLPEHPAAALAVLTQQQADKAVDMNTPNTALSHEQQKAIIDAKDVLLNKSLVMRQLGQAEAFDFMRKLAKIGQLKLVQTIKENKEYKGLVYLDTDGNRQQVATWDDYCLAFLGESRRTIDERLANLAVFGEEFFEASQKIGLGYRELRKLRQLPADQQQLVIENEAVELGDKDALRELIDDLNAKHQQELKAAKGEKAELEQALKVARQMRDEAQAEANKHKEVLAQRKFNPESWKRDVSQIVTDIATLEGTVLQALTKLVALRTKIAESDSDDVFAKDPATYHAAMEFMCGAMHHASRCLAEDVALFWQDTDVMLGAYTDKARPALEVLEQLAQNASQGSEE
jgi:hypothetical protein